MLVAETRLDDGDVEFERRRAVPRLGQLDDAACVVLCQCNLCHLFGALHPLQTLGLVQRL